MLQIFDGPNIRDLTSDEVEELPDGLRTVLMDTLQHARAAEAGEARVAAARIAVRDLMQAYDAALAADHAANPPVTAVAALRQVIAAGQPGYKPSKSSKANQERDALASADVALAVARAELVRADADCKTLSAARADAIMRWINANPEKITPNALLRDHINRSQQARQDIASGKVSAPEVVQPVRQNEIDRVLSARGRARVR